jgi:tRNA 2-selenouridine synthase
MIDVRSPCEYAKGHIPGAFNVPLFSDEERSEVGTLYKQKGHDIAVGRGLEIVDRTWQKLLTSMPTSICEGEDLLVYCKRGGMRSGGVAWLLSQAPLNVRILEGGYAAFRGWALNDAYEKHAPPVFVIGGRTGSGKTEVLHALRDDLRTQVIDLEGAANHRGSAFGALGLPPQPPQQMYENVLALEWARCSETEPVFVEDEGAHVGSCGVPAGLWGHMRAEHTPILRVEVPRASRIERLVREYGPHGTEPLSAAVRALAKKLGPERTDELLEHLSASPPRLAQVADALLTHYYDSLYDKKAAKRAETVNVHLVSCDQGDASHVAPLVLARARELLATREGE